MAEAARCIAESAARLGGGPYLAVKWSEFIDPKPGDSRTPAQVKAHLIGLLQRCAQPAVTGR